MGARRRGRREAIVVVVGFKLWVGDEVVGVADAVADGEGSWGCSAEVSVWFGNGGIGCTIQVRDCV